MLRQSLNCKQVSALGLPPVYRVNHTKIRLSRDYVQVGRVYTFKHQSQHGLRSIELRWSYANDHTCPVAREASWSSKQPQPITANSTSHVWVGPDTIFSWLKCVLNEGCVQFGPYMYRQTSGVFMGTSPAAELANDFAFWHE